MRDNRCRLRDRNSIDAFELQTICNAVTLSRDKANDMMRPIDRDQPPPYNPHQFQSTTLFMVDSGRG